MQVGDVAHIDDVEAEPWDAGNLSGHQPLDDLDGLRKVAAHDGSEDERRIDCREGRRAAGGGDEVPSAALGNGFGLGVGVGTGIGGVGPGRLVAGAIGRAVGWTGRRHRRSHHHPLHARLDRRLERPSRAVSGGDDQIVRVLGHRHTEWRGDVDHVIAALGGGVPARVAGEVRGMEAQAIKGVGRRRQGGAHRALAREVSDGGPNRISLLQQGDDAVAADVTGAPRHKNRFTRRHPHLPLLSLR
jgi:hypothetical protein